MYAHALPTRMERVKMSRPRKGIEAHPAGDENSTKKSEENSTEKTEEYLRFADLKRMGIVRNLKPWGGGLRSGVSHAVESYIPARAGRGFGPRQKSGNGLNVSPMVAVMLTADAIIAAMKGCAVLHVAYVEGEPIYWLSESNGLASVIRHGRQGGCSITIGHGV